MIHQRAITPSYVNVLQILFNSIPVFILDILLKIRIYFPPTSSEVYGDQGLHECLRFPVLASCVYAKTTLYLHLSRLLQFALNWKIKDCYTQ